MQLTKIEKNGVVCAVVNSNELLDAQSALDVFMSAKHDIAPQNIIIDKRLIIDDFFILSKGLVGEIIQKYVNYGGRIAIYGDYSHYTSKPLKDSIYETNKGKDVLFVATQDEAMQC